MNRSINSGKMCDKVCQMLLWWMKNWRHSINILDTFTKEVPLYMYSVYQAPSHKPVFTLLATGSTELTY